MWLWLLMCAAAALSPPELKAVRVSGSSDTELSPGDLAGHRVGLYFGASWCAFFVVVSVMDAVAGPACRNFEPSLVAVREALQPMTLIYVSSDGSADEARKRSEGLKMPLAVEAKTLKERYGIWAGRERSLQGRRRSGVPAIVVLGPTGLEEVAFLPAEAQGPGVLGDWPRDEAYLW